MPYSRGVLFHILKNRVYLGEIVHGSDTSPGLPLPIIERDLFDRVQKRLASNAIQRADRPFRSAELVLKGKLFDAEENPMVPSFGYGRAGKVYRYYGSAPLQLSRGHTVDRSFAIRRVTAEAIHEIVRTAIGPRIRQTSEDDLQAAAGALQRVEIMPGEVRFILQADRLTPGGRKGLPMEAPNEAVLTVPVRCKMRGGRVEQALPSGVKHQQVRRDPTLVRGLQQAHRLAATMGWHAGDGSVNHGGMVQPKSAYERKPVRLAFLAPAVQRAILAGTQAPNLTLARLLHEPIPTD